VLAVSAASVRRASRCADGRRAGLSRLPAPRPGTAWRAAGTTLEIVERLAREIALGCKDAGFVAGSTGSASMRLQRG